jgi:hypothetical protein
LIPTAAQLKGEGHQTGSESARASLIAARGHPRLLAKLHHKALGVIPPAEV